MTINGPSGAIFAQGSTIHIENSTFSSEFSVNSDTDVFLTNSTLSGTYLQLGGLLITNHSCINITNSEVKVLNNYKSFSVFVKHDSSAHFTSTIFLSGQQEQFDDLIQYDSEFLSYNFPSVFSTCNSSSVVLDYCNFINTTEFRIYLSSNITFLNTTFENNAGIYEVSEDSNLQFDGCSLLRGSEKVFANKGSVVSIKNSNIAQGRSKITLVNKSLLSLFKTNIYDNTLGNAIVAQFQSTVMISNCLYSNNSRIQENNATEVDSNFFSKMIKTMAAAVNDTAAFINISSSTISLLDSTWSENVGTLIVTSMSNVTFNNCTIENNVAISNITRLMEFISSNVIIEHCSFSNNNNSLFVPNRTGYSPSKSIALISIRSGLRELGNFVRLDSSRFSNSGVISLENILDTCIQNCNFSNTYFEMESVSIVDVLRNMSVLRISTSNFDSVYGGPYPQCYPYIEFVKFFFPGFYSLLDIFKHAFFQIFTYRLYPQTGLYASVTLRQEEHAYASGKFLFEFFMIGRH